MKAVFCDLSEFELKEVDRFKSENPSLVIAEYSGDVSSIDQKDHDASVISIFIDSKIDEKTLEGFPNLKFILTRSTGLDHIDLNACKSHGISVYSVPDYGSETVAEFTFLLMLMLARRLNASKAGINRFARGNDLEGKTLGIVGAGRIGTNVARIANAFGMKLLYNSHKNSEYIDSLGGKKMELNELLHNSDIVTLHVPLSDSTFHMINHDNIKSFKQGAYLINTARGAVIDTEALIEGLESGVIGGAALDVVEGEEFAGKEMEVIRRKENYEILKSVLETNVLSRFDNVILTPHIAYNTAEAMQRIINHTLNDLLAIASGKTPSD